ncbi:endonuclease domain-containing protein [Tomitella gaofuii]|uniref:endonuclease domain-containing protein n=1 Tax=Tomitella gaofuii TaxID=2760083 RepID=UPI0015F7D449|nr:DUF559 domain-containing protein [Tomitella gaofuii]
MRTRCRRLMPGIHLRRDVEYTAERQARALTLWLRGRAVLAGFSAAVLWDTKWIDADRPAACNCPRRLPAPEGVDVYRDVLTEGDVTARHGIALTTPVRTAFDLGRRLELDDAVAVLDAMYQTKRVRKQQLADYARRHPGSAHIRRLREAIVLSDEGGESPQETRTRLAIIRDGLPRPATQKYVLRSDGTAIGRVDMLWPQWRVIVEYEGDGHRAGSQFDRDCARWNALQDHGWQVVRVKNGMLDPDERGATMRLIRDALWRSGAPVDQWPSPTHPWAPSATHPGAAT